MNKDLRHFIHGLPKLNIRLIRVKYAYVFKDVLSFNPDIETDALDSPFVCLNSYMLQWWAGLFENYHRNSAFIK